MEQQRRPPGPQNASSSQQQQQQPRGQQVSPQDVATPQVLLPVAQRPGLLPLATASQPPAAQRKQPEPPAGAHLYVNKPWSPKAVLTERSLSRPPSVVFTKKTLERLFGWTHGACKDICPTVVFRCTPPGGGAPTELEPVQLLPPSRDDRDVEHKKREGGMRGRVDGYPVPGPAVKKLLVQLFGGTSPAGHRLHFRSAGWRGTQLVVDASHEAAGAGEGPGEASDGEGQEGETSQPGPQRSAGGAAHSQAQAMPAPTAAAAAAAAASPADERQQEGWTGAAASTGNRAVPAANAAASSGRQPAPASQDVIVIDDESPPIRSPQATIPLEVPVKQAAPSHSFSGLGGLVAAAEQASAGGASAGGPPAGAGAALPLMASLDSLQPAAQRIVQEAHSGWLSTDQVHKLMASHKALGVPLAEQQPFRPQAGDLFLADRQLRFDKKDGHSWVDRRSNKLKVDGKDVLQVVYFTTRDGTLQRRAYHFLPGCEPQGGQVHPHLLHYQLPEALLNSEKGKPGPKKRVSDAQQADRQARRQAAAQVPLPPSPPMHQAQRQGSQGAEPAALGFNPTPLDLARWSREEKIWAECGDIVRNLLDQATLEVFGQPVDPVKVPEYYQAVKQPMDLGTILSKLSATPRGYSSPLEFRDDVRLTFANCRLFNPEGTSVRKLGDAASARFEAEWKAALVEARWEANRLPTEQARQAQQQAQQLLQQQPQQAPTTRQQQHQQQSPPPLLPQQAQQAQQQQPQQAPTTRQQQHQQQSPPPPLPQPPQQPQQPAGRPTQPAVPCSAQAAGAAAAEAAAAAAAAQAEAEAAATLSPQARLAQQRAGRAERMYSGGYSMPDLDGEGEEEEVEEEQQQRRPRSPSAGWHAWMHAGAPAGWREQQLAASSAAQPQRQLAVLSAGRPQRQAAKVARKRTAADLAADAAALAEQLGSSSEEEEDLDIVRRSTARPATQQAQQAKVALKAERLAAEQRRQELATAAEERQRNAAAEAERRAAEQRQRQQQEALERRAAQQRQQEAAAAEAEHHRQQQDAAAAEAEQQRQQQEAAVAEAERQRQAAEEERRAQQAQYAQQQQQQQQQAQQEEKQPGQKREREGAAAGTSETLPDAKRQATMAQPPAVHPEKQPEIQVEQQPGASPHAGSGSMAPPAAKLADRNAAVGDAIIILRRAQVPGPRMTEFVTKFIQGNNNASDVAGIMDLLRAVDAACNAQAVCALVDTYMAQ